MKIIAVLLSLLLPFGLYAEENADTLFLEMTDNSMLVIPEKFILGQTETNQDITFSLLGDSTITISKSELVTVHKTYPYERPAFLSFKFNNKFNDQLFTDADTLEINPAQGLIRMQAACIGKRLTPSFKLPDGARAYVDGVEQVSKQSSQRFASPVRYTVGYPGQDIYRLVKLDDSKYTLTSTEWVVTDQVELTAEMLSTNAPSNYDEHPANLLDGDASTNFHSTWGSGDYTPLEWFAGAYYGDGESEWPYLQIALPEAMSELQFTYSTRINSDRAPLGFILQASNDGVTWTDIRTFTAETDGLPTLRGATYESPVVELGDAYSYLRLQLTAAQRKNYFVLSEFSIHKVKSVTKESDKVWQPLPMPLSVSNLSSDDAKASLISLLDGDTSSGCTLTYNPATSRWPYVQIQVPELTHNLQFSYTTLLAGDVNGDGEVSIADVTTLVNVILGRSSLPSTESIVNCQLSIVNSFDVNGDGTISIADVTELVNIILGKSQKNYAPLGLELQGSTDGSVWTTLQAFTAEADGLPTMPKASFVSPVIVTDIKYPYLRLQPTASQDAATLRLGSLSLSDVASCHRGLEPYGTNYEVQVDFLTDHSLSEYNVPRIDIWFGDSTSWSSSMWIGQNGKDYYEDAAIQIDGVGIFPDMPRTDIQIKGRGNSSWSQSSSSKNPYRIKFSQKVKPFGMVGGKSWILLANKQTGSMTTNAIAMKMANIVETRGANHIVPVELYINNQYRGSYNFTEKPGFANNSIDLVDESRAVMLELDRNYDEPYKFRDDSYNLPVNLKEPNLANDVEDNLLTKEEAQAQLEKIKKQFNFFTADILSGNTTYVDVESFVRAMFVTDLTRNCEFMHPKSWKLYNPNFLHPDSLWNFGPVWDFDWAYGYNSSPKRYFVDKAETDIFDAASGSDLVGKPFILQLLRGTDTVKKAYYRLWTEFMESGRLEELFEYCDDYFEYVNPSFQHNATKWSDGNDYATHNENAKNWLRLRADFIYQHLDAYDLNDDILDAKEDSETTKVLDLSSVKSRLVNVYSINGMLVRRAVAQIHCLEGLSPGIYIVNGQKYVVK